MTVLRPDVAPGTEAQIDYGFLGSWVDPITAKVRRIWAFVMTLAFSRYMFVRPVLCMDATSWTASHVAAFAFFGSTPARLVPDNLATGVARPDLYDPLINRSYAELAEHYGALVDPARVRKPKDKALSSHCTSWVGSDGYWFRTVLRAGWPADGLARDGGR